MDVADVILRFVKICHVVSAHCDSYVLQREQGVTMLWLHLSHPNAAERGHGSALESAADHDDHPSCGAEGIAETADLM